nr:MAG TPA: hypothetical protein [Caudoviricetes sp.]
MILGISCWVSGAFHKEGKCANQSNFGRRWPRPELCHRG